MFSGAIENEEDADQKHYQGLNEVSHIHHSNEIDEDGPYKNGELRSDGPAGEESKSDQQSSDKMCGRHIMDGQHAAAKTLQWLDEFGQDEALGDKVDPLDEKEDPQSHP